MSKTIKLSFMLAKVLTALGQMSTSAEAGLPALSIGEAIVQVWLQGDLHYDSMDELDDLKTVLKPSWQCRGLWLSVAKGVSHVNGKYSDRHIRCWR